MSNHIHVAGSFQASMVKQLVGLGFDRELAERQVAQQVEGAKLAQTAAAPDPVRPTRTIAFPLTITLPWSALISDNRKYAAAHRKHHERPLVILTGEYRAAKEKIKGVVRHHVAGCALVEVPLALEARVWMPDNRLHDVANFSKCVHDALEKLVYANDTWLYDVRWIRAGVDVDCPRAELTITPLTP